MAWVRAPRELSMRLELVTFELRPTAPSTRASQAKEARGGLIATFSDCWSIELTLSLKVVVDSMLCWTAFCLAALTIGRVEPRSFSSKKPTGYLGCFAETPRRCIKSFRSLIVESEPFRFSICDGTMWLISLIKLGEGKRGDWSRKRGSTIFYEDVFVCGLFSPRRWAVSLRDSITALTCSLARELRSWDTKCSPAAFSTSWRRRNCVSSSLMALSSI